ncbi:MAG: response regulator, partial [Candidatus Omnitrophota bacterium]
GYVVNLAKDGEEAIEIARRKPEDIVFIDMKLPALNGLETYLALKKIDPNMKAVMMTAYRQETKDLVQEALKNNAYTCIYKPFPPQEAVEIVEEIIREKGNKGVREEGRGTMAKTILIIDDRETIRTSLADVLAESGYRVLEAATGEEGLEKAREEKPDLMVVDTAMPGIDGHEVCRQIKEIERLPIKVLIYTGALSAINPLKARRAGADDYIVKGLSPLNLIEAIEKLI